MCATEREKGEKREKKRFGLYRFKNTIKKMKESAILKSYAFIQALCIMALCI